MLCRFQVAFCAMQDGVPHMIDDMEELPDPIQKIRQGIIRTFSEHGHEVSFVEENVLEVEVDDPDEIEKILNDVMEQNGAVRVTPEEGGIDGFYGEPDFFGEPESDDDWWR